MGMIAPGATEEDCIMCCCKKHEKHDEMMKFTLRVSSKFVNDNESSDTNNVLDW